MDTNDLINPRKDLINSSTDNVTSKPYDFRADRTTELIGTNSAELTEFNYLLAHYKAKVLERYAFLYKF